MPSCHCGIRTPPWACRLPSTGSRATFSLPSLVGYLVPLRLAFTAQVLTTLVVAGSGAFVLGRLMRLSVLAATFAGTVFELSGAFVFWLGWPIGSVLSWAGWLFAAVLLITRGNRRVPSVAFFAVALAFAVYGGTTRRPHPAHRVRVHLRRHSPGPEGSEAGGLGPDSEASLRPGRRRCRRPGLGRPPRLARLSGRRSGHPNVRRFDIRPPGGLAIPGLGPSCL